MSTLPHFKDDDFRLLFLDIDDVLASVKTCLAYGDWPHPYILDNEKDGQINPSPPQRRFRLGEPPVTSKEAFDDVAVKLVDRLCKKTDTHVVLSSTWRLSCDADDVRRMLEYIGIDSDRVIGRTTSEWKTGQVRGDEIQQFLDELKKNTSILVEKGLLAKELAGKSLTPKSYVILDDSSDMLESQQSHFVHVSELEGLSLQNVLSAGAVLTQSVFTTEHLA